MGTGVCGSIGRELEEGTAEEGVGGGQLGSLGKSCARSVDVSARG